MPELPEVEYTARQLRASIVEATIQEVEIFWERTIGYPTPSMFRMEIAQKRIEEVRRRGKFLLLDLSEDLLLTIHRRMTGNLLLLPPGWLVDDSLRITNHTAWNTHGPTFFTTETTQHLYTHEVKYCRVCFNLSDGRRLLFTDPRKFGRITLWPRSRETEALSGLGPEPFSREFTVNFLEGTLAKRTIPIKQALLDQRTVAGLGNIYADEALFFAGIHPLQRSNLLTSDKVCQLHRGIVSVLETGIEHGGTSFNDYRDLWGEAGSNYNHVAVYHQTGKPCIRCGTPIERIVVSQRSTHFCPQCQQLTME